MPNIATVVGVAVACSSTTTTSRRCLLVVIAAAGHVAHHVQWRATVTTRHIGEWCTGVEQARRITRGAAALTHLQRHDPEQHPHLTRRDWLREPHDLFAAALRCTALHCTAAFIPERTCLSCCAPTLPEAPQWTSLTWPCTSHHHGTGLACAAPRL